MYLLSLMQINFEGVAIVCHFVYWSNSTFEKDKKFI